MVFVSKDNLGGDFRIIPRLLNLRFFIIVHQFFNFKILNCHSNVAPTLDQAIASVKTLNALCQLMFFNKAVAVDELLYPFKFAVGLKDVEL